MKILKFYESQNSDQILIDIFQEASKEFEEIQDLFLEIQDSVNFKFGYNYCAYCPTTEEFLIPHFLCDNLNTIKECFYDDTIDDIISNQSNISFMIGVACVPEELPSANVETFGGDEIEGVNNEFVSYNQTHLSNFVKLSQVLKQADIRLKKDKYDVKYQFDNFGATLLIGRKNINGK